MGWRLGMQDWAEVFDGIATAEGHHENIMTYLDSTHTSQLQALHIEQRHPIEAGKWIDQESARTIVRRYISAVKLSEDGQREEKEANEPMTRFLYALAAALITLLSVFLTKLL